MTAGGAAGGEHLGDGLELLHAGEAGLRAADEGAEVGAGRRAVVGAGGDEAEDDGGLLGAEAGALGEVAALVAAALAEEGADAVRPEAVELVDGAEDDAAAVGVAVGVGGVEEAGDLHDSVQHLAVVDADQVVAARDAGGLERLAEHRAHLGVGGDARRSRRCRRRTGRTGGSGPGPGFSLRQTGPTW